MILAMILWPITAVIIWTSIKGVKKEWKRKILQSIFIFLSVLFLITWLVFALGIVVSNKNKSNVSSVSPTPMLTQQGDCLGPDGKWIQLSPDECQKFNDAWKNPPQQNQEQTQAQQPTSTPVISKEYDKNKGNNYVAAQAAEAMQSIIDKAAEGAVLNVFIELSPEDPSGKTEEEYKGSLTSAFVQIQVSQSFWNSLTDDYKKDLVASFVTSVGNIFPRPYPHVYVNNGVREVATGEYNLLKSEAQVKLK